jgi:phenylacetate-CoA ligase
MQLRSCVPGLGWPAILPPRSTGFYAVWRQLNDSQWLGRAEIEQLQREQLFRRLSFAAQHQPDWPHLIRRLPWQATDVPLAQLMSELPILTRRDLQTSAGTWRASAPVSHGKVSELKTSGSSGEPVSVRVTAQVFMLRAALTLRGHEWHGLNFKAPFAAIRGGIREKNGMASMDAPQWGGMVSSLVATGNSHALDITTPVDEQVGWLRARRPAILLSLPSNLEALLDLIPEKWPALSHVLTISETLTPSLRQRLQSQWQCRVYDKYSSEELGSIAIECAHGNYHTSEHLIVEVLREDGTACQPGEVGRVVITDTWNFATHMVRYDIRDYAIAGSTCACGRGLPVLSRIMGRVRHLMVLPDGRRFWPLFGMRQYGEIAPIHQMQFVQTAVDALLIRYVCDRALDDSEMQAVVLRVNSQVGHAMNISFERSLVPLNAGAGYKFEEFKSLVDIPQSGSIFTG